MEFNSVQEIFNRLNDDGIDVILIDSKQLELDSYGKMEYWALFVFGRDKKYIKEIKNCLEVTNQVLEPGEDILSTLEYMYDDIIDIYHERETQKAGGGTDER